MSDPNFYRYYDCNIQCPKMKARTMRADTLLASSIDATDIESQSLTTTNLDATSITTGSINATSGDLTANKIEATEICSSPADVCFFSGTSALATTHTITSTQLPHLTNARMSGSLTFYLENDVYINTSMAAIVKTRGTIVQVIIYQRIGNYTTVEIASSGNNQIIITTNPASQLRWIFMGV